jgi:hypothetical protein
MPGTIYPAYLIQGNLTVIFVSRVNNCVRLDPTRFCLLLTYKEPCWSVPVGCGCTFDRRHALDTDCIVFDIAMVLVARYYFPPCCQPHYTVGQLSSRTEAKKNCTKKKKKFVKTITQYSPRPLPHNVYIAHATNRMPEKTLLPISPSVLSSQSVYIFSARYYHMVGYGFWIFPLSRNVS